MEAYGYIYKTTIQTSNGEKIYFGQKKSSVFIPTYFGSGRKIKNWLQKHKYDYSDKIFVELLEWAYSYEELNELEAKYVEPHLNKAYCWNLVNGGNMPKVTDEFRLAISKGHHNLSDEAIQEWKNKISKNNKSGTLEVRAKISKTLKGSFHHTEEAKKKISIASRNMSDETKRKISEKLKGRCHTQETKEKISIANKGKLVSLETRQKLSLSLKGRHHTEETKKKISNSMMGINIGRKLNEETKRKISLAQTGENNNNYGKSRAESTKKLISQNNGKNISILCIETNERFYNLNNCSNLTGLNAHYISEICDNNVAANPRLLKKYDADLINKLKKYKGCHFIKV